MNARELALIAHDYLLAEGHNPTWAKCRCWGGRDLHAAIEKALPARTLAELVQRAEKHTEVCQ